MEIIITSGVGSGSTKLAAFDAALNDAGIANYNLIKLSSVIPPNSSLVFKKYRPQKNDHGKRLYVVLSECFTEESDQQIFAGLGWVLKKDGGGLFVEHCGHVSGEVDQKIEKTLTDMISYRNESYGEIKNKIICAKSNEKPTCVLVAAVYKSESW